MLQGPVLATILKLAVPTILVLLAQVARAASERKLASGLKLAPAGFHVYVMTDQSVNLFPRDRRHGREP
jgi:hypothetical protein